MLIIVLVYVTINQFQKSNQIKIKRAHELSQLNELKTWLGDDSLRLMAQNKINQSYQDLMQNSEITQQPNMAWLRLMVEEHGLQFIDFQKIKANQVRLDIRGSEKEFWSFINQVKVESPWIRVKQVQLTPSSKTSKKSKRSRRSNRSRNQKAHQSVFNINQLILDWPLSQPTKNKASTKVSDMSTSGWAELVQDSSYQALLNTSSPQTQEPMYSENPDSLKSVLTFKKISSPQIKIQPSTSHYKAAVWPNTWQVVGNMPSRGVQIKTSSPKVQTHFWKIGMSFENWTLKEVYSTRGVFRDPQGVQLELNW